MIILVVGLTTGAIKLKVVDMVRRAVDDKNIVVIDMIEGMKEETIRQMIETAKVTEIIMRKSRKEATGEKIRVVVLLRSSADVLIEKVDRQVLS